MKPRFMRQAVFCLLSGLLMMLCLAGKTSLAAPGQVTLLKTPDGGIQPQAAMDSKGVVHLIFFKGDPQAGDLYYTRMSPGERGFRPTLRVNSQPGSAIAIGTIRGGQIAIGKDDVVHVAWNGSGVAEPKGPGGNPMLYTRLNAAGTGFEPQRNLITWAGGLDGGGSVAADAQGDVYVVWHANPNKNGEANRAVYLAHSTDNGETFAKEKRINPDPTGACSCCSLRAFVDRNHTLYVFYRAATESVHRDMILLTSHDKGGRFDSLLVHKWEINACPMSSAAFAQGKDYVIMAWETREKVYFASWFPDRKVLSPQLQALRNDGKGDPASSLFFPPGTGPTRKHPTLAINMTGAMLLAWTEGTGWNRGGSVAWQVIDAGGNVRQGRSEGVPAWGLLSAFARPDGSFVLLY
ncbi:MAG TPA: hypothetical protein VKU00_01800 [Chthonomonadaceae bacterium]|nr:hypothetical protein [Chthonomonadaceae bacterium]